MGSWGDFWVLEVVVGSCWELGLLGVVVELLGAWGKFWGSEVVVLVGSWYTHLQAS